MSDPIFFSVVVPSYNRADIILETIDSVLTQSYPHFELLVIDNCSTDHTDAVLQPLADAGKIRYIKHDRNYERGRSRNTGMAAAAGLYLTFLDSDDFMYPDCLKDAADFIKKDPTVKVFQNEYEFVNNDRVTIYRPRFPSLKNQYKALASGNFISCIGGFIHSDIYKAVRFSEDPRMVGSEDYELWFEILARYPMKRIEKINSGVREHVNRSVHQGIYDNLEYQKAYLVTKIKNSPELFNRFGPYLNRLSASFLLQESIVMNQLKHKGRAFSYLLGALLKDKSIITTRRFFGVVYNLLKK